MGQPNQNTDREVKAADVQRGDHIWRDREVREVTHTQVLPEGWHLIVFDNGATTRIKADTTIRLATDDDMAEAEQSERRLVVAGTLRQIADLIVSEQLPMPRWDVRMHWMVRSPASVRDVAERLGWTLDQPTPDHHHVAVEREFAGEPSVTVRFHAQEAPAEPPSIEDGAPRGTDDAEEHAPKPVDVDGYTHKRGRPFRAVKS